MSPRPKESIPTEPDDQVLLVAPSATIKESLHHTLASEIKPEQVIAEGIDNALDFTPEGEVCHVNIDLFLHPRDDFFRIANFPSTGATRDELSRLNTLGRKSQDVRGGDYYSGHHGVGFMTGAYSLLDPDSGGLFAHTFVTDIDGQPHYVDYNRPNWHDQIDRDVNIVYSPEPGPEIPTTTFTLKHLNPEIAQVFDPRLIADYLGLIYGPLIRDGRLHIRFMAQEHHRTDAKTIPIIPVEIPFEGNITQTDWFSVAPEDQGPFIRITYAPVNRETKEAHESRRNRTYTQTHRHPQTTLYNQDVLFFSGGKLDHVTTLDGLNIPYAKSRVTPIIAVVEIEPHPHLKKTAFKTSYDPKDQTSQAVFAAVHDFFTPIVEKYAKQARSEETLTRSNLDLLNATYEQLAQVTGQLFTPEEFSHKFGIDLTFLSDTSTPDMSVEALSLQVPTRENPKPRQRLSKTNTLPGGTRHFSPHCSTLEKDPSSGDHYYEITVDNPFPTIIVGSFDSPIQATIDPVHNFGDHEMPAVILNSNEARIATILASKTHRRLDKLVIAAAALEALFDHAGETNPHLRRDTIQRILSQIN